MIDRIVLGLIKAVIVTIITIPLALVGGWALMFVFSILHTSVLTAVIPAGYRTCVVLAWLLISFLRCAAPLDIDD